MMDKCKQPVLVMIFIWTCMLIGTFELQKSSPRFLKPGPYTFSVRYIYFFADPEIMNGQDINGRDLS